MVFWPGNPADILPVSREGSRPACVLCGSWPICFKLPGRRRNWLGKHAGILLTVRRYMQWNTHIPCIFCVQVLIIYNFIPVLSSLVTRGTNCRRSHHSRASCLLRFQPKRDQDDRRTAEDKMTGDKITGGQDNWRTR